MSPRSFFHSGTKIGQTVAERDDIQEKVISAVRTVSEFPPTVIPLDTRMELLVVDSMAQMSLIAELEAVFGIDIPANELVEGVKTLGDLVEKMRRVSADAAMQGL
jgi:acyl carrier protein